MWRVAPLLITLSACSPVTKTFFEGAPCVTAGDAVCETGRARLLECQSSRWALISDCRSDAGCVMDQQTTDCDTSGNTLGDHCPPASEGKVRCDPVGQRRIIRCVNGVFALALECPQFTRCGQTPDAGLNCG